MAVQVTALHQNDREQWEKLYNAYAEFYKVPMNRQILDQVWQWIFDPEKRFFSVIAKDETGVAVGLMHYREMHSPLRGAQVGFLDDLFVEPNCRGGGVADLMFARLKQEAKTNGWPFTRWITAENNYRARAVYDRLADKTPWLTYQLSSD